MNCANNFKINHQLIFEINKQVLSLIACVAAQDMVRAQFIFGLSEKLIKMIKGLGEAEIDKLSSQAISFLTLRNSANEDYWENLMVSANHNTTAHKLHLQALVLMQAETNEQDLVQNQ